MQLVDKSILNNKKYKREHTTKCEVIIQNSKTMRKFMCQKKIINSYPLKKNSSMTIKKLQISR